MKYFSPNYWFKLWLLSAPLFNDKTQGINAKSIDNKNIKDWASKNTNLQSIENQELTLSNNQTIPLQNDENIKLIKNLETDHFYENFLKTQGWSRDPQIAQQQLQEIQEEHHYFLEEQHKRIKRSNKDSKKILQVPEALIINFNNRNQYQESFERIIAFLIDNRVLNIEYTPSTSTSNEDLRILTTNPETYGYFRLPVEIRGNQQSSYRTLELVLRVRNLYLEGIILNVTQNGGHTEPIYNYYHFSDSNLQEIDNAISNSFNDRSILSSHSDSSNINPITGEYCNFLWQSSEFNNNIYWDDIYDSFHRLTTMQGYSLASDNRLLRLALSRVILVTSESLRFRIIYNDIINNIIINNNYIVWGLNSNNNDSNIHQILSTWKKCSKKTAQYLKALTIKEKLNPGDSIKRNKAKDFPLLNESIENLTAWLLNNNNLRILLETIILNNFDYDKFIKRKPRNLNNFKLIIKGKVNCAEILDENTKSANLKAEDIYVGTTEGFYLIHDNGVVNKIDNIDDEVTSIKVLNNQCYITTKKEEVYEIETDYIVSHNSVYGKIQTNMHSSDLNKELKLYYDESGENFNPWERQTCSCPINKEYLLNVKKINILNYEKLDFIGNNFLTKTSWGNSAYYGKTIFEFFKEKKNMFKDILNKKESEEEYWTNLQYDKMSGLKPSFLQWFALSNYKKENNYFFKIKIHSQVCQACIMGLCQGGGAWFNIGKGIRLYNDDRFETQIQNPNDRKRREIFDINNLKEKNELKNITQWTNDFTKIINNEQHLPIDNKTNFVTNNITSL